MPSTQHALVVVPTTVYYVCMYVGDWPPSMYVCMWYRYGIYYDVLCGVDTDVLSSGVLPLGERPHVRSRHTVPCPM